MGRLLPAPRARMAPLALALALVALLCAAPSAFAVKKRSLLGSFGPDGTAATTFDYSGPLAFDQGSRRLYVLDQDASKVYGFDASAGGHTPLSGGGFPLAVSDSHDWWVDDIAVDGSSHSLYYLSEADATLYGFDPSGNTLAGFPVSGFSDPCGAAVDPSGNVWVGDYGADAVKGYSSSGAPLALGGSVDTSAQGDPCHVAFDSTGNMYVAMYYGPVYEYFAASNYSPGLSVEIDSGSTLAITVDRSSGDLYVVHSDVVDVYDSSGNQLYSFGGEVHGASFDGVAVDETSGHAYVADASSGLVYEFGPYAQVPDVTTGAVSKNTDGASATLNGTVNPDGVPVTDCHFQYGPTAAYGKTAQCVETVGGGGSAVNVHADASGLSPGTTYHYRLVASNANGSNGGEDESFRTPSAPSIDAVSIDDVTATSALVKVTVRAGYVADATWHVDYGTTSSYGQSTSSTVIDVSGGNDEHAASALITGLKPGTAYHFQVVASNAVKTVRGSGRVVTTYGAAQAPASCPNDALRGRSSAHLPDCRAYEQVSPAVKAGADVMNTQARTQAADNGGAFVYSVPSGLPGLAGYTTLNANYVASRGASQWSSINQLTPASQPWGRGILSGWSPDLTKTLAVALIGGKTKVVAIDNTKGTYQVVTDVANANPVLAGFSADDSHVVFESEAPLLASAAAGQTNLYDYDLLSGKLSLAGVLPDGSVPADGSFAGAYAWTSNSGSIGSPTTDSGVASAGYDSYYAQGAVSDDRSSVYFTVGGSGQIYLRTDPTSAGATTDHVSASQKTNGGGVGGVDADGPQPAAFMYATPDGAHAFFASPEELTNDANTGPTPAIGRASIDGTSPEQTFVPAAAAGIAVDGSYVYWANPNANTIGRAKLDGSDFQPDFITGASNPQGVAVDGSHVYWTNAADGKQGTGTIGRADLDGSNVNQAFVTGAYNPEGIAVDASHIYWGNCGYALNGVCFGSSMGRANIDGSQANQGFISGGQAYAGIAVTSSHIYWTNGYGNIGRANINGTGPNQSFIRGVTDRLEAHGLATDGSYLYWSDSGTGAVGRADIGGTNVDKGFVTGATSPQGVAVDSSHVYWSSNGGDQGNDLYRYDAVSGKLTDLSVGTTASDANGADVQGVLGASADGSYVYFVANGVLANGVTAGDCVFGKPLGRTCNLYVSHDGAVRFIAQLNSGTYNDFTDWAPYPTCCGGRQQRTARVTPDGHVLLFTSMRQLTSYDNAGYTEVYRYDATAKSDPLRCVSCSPQDSAPVGDAGLRSNNDGGVAGGKQPVLPTLARNLSDGGDQVFFETSDPLLSGDTNGTLDVYEWEADGAGGCRSSADNGGCLYLLSTGRSPDPSYFGDASASGADAYIITDQQLVGQDGDTSYDVYDARVDGGLGSQNPPAPVRPCQGAGCKPSPDVRGSGAVPGSVSFTTVGTASIGRRARTAAVFHVRALSRRQRRRLARGRRIGLRVRVSERGKVRAVIHARLRRGRHRARVRAVARAAHRARAGGTARVHLRLSKRARRYLRHHRRLRVAIKVRYSKAPKAQRARLTLARRARHSSRNQARAGVHRRSSHDLGGVK